MKNGLAEGIIEIRLVDIVPIEVFFSCRIVTRLHRLPQLFMLPCNIRLFKTVLVLIIDVVLSKLFNLFVR